MLTKNFKVVCDSCGKFISAKDIYENKATHNYVLPDSEFSRETYESECAKCRSKK